MRRALLYSLIFLFAAGASLPAEARPVRPSQKPATEKQAAMAENAFGPQLAEAETVAGQAAEEALPVQNIDETAPLPDYPIGARIAMGEMKTYTVGEEDTLLDIARHFGLGFVEMRAANPGMDPWTPPPGQKVVIPSFRLLPRARQEGVVVNLAEMRLYYFKNPGKAPYTYPIGVGREGLETPTGATTVLRKVAGPSWFPTERMRTEKPWLPESIPAGPANPLGTHALYLGWPTFLIHGSNKPWAIGRRVSSGCMRMYPEDIVDMYNMVPAGTKVTVVDQPILVGWVNSGLYLEAHPTKTQSNDIEISGMHTVEGLSDGLKQVIMDAAGGEAAAIDWQKVERVVRERAGYPVLIASARHETTEAQKSRRRGRRDYN
jgi:L,D-transpeptidase ErfK/SrfK